MVAIIVIASTDLWARKMNRITLVLVVLAFVQLVKGQQACIDATAALAANTACTNAFNTATDASVICMGSCRTLFDNIVNNCGAAGSAYSTLISTLCDGGNAGAACTAAISSVSDACGTSLLNGDNSVCSGTCATQLNAAVSACASSSNTDIRATLGAYNTLCGSGGAECATATAAILADTTCDPETVEASVLCTGSCRTLADNFINACPASDAAVMVIRGEVNRLCGSGNMLKASGVITLLIVAISALIF